MAQTEAGEAKKQFRVYRNTALIIAATIPMEARTSDNMLTSPPRTLGAKDRRRPNTPKASAIMASKNPAEALTKKLAMAAAIAMIEGILKCGFSCTLCMDHPTSRQREF